MKRYLWALMLVIVLLCPLALAEETAQLRIELDRTEGYGGDVVNMSVYLTAENLGGLQTTIEWNDGYLSYVDGSAAFETAFVQNAQMSMINDTLNNSIRLVYGNTNGYSAEDALIFKAAFQLKDDVSGTTEFSFSSTKLTNSSANLAQITAETFGASVTTSIYNAGEAKLVLSRDVSRPYVGDTITVGMSVSSTGDAIGSLQGTINYDTSVFEYVDGSASFSDAGQAAAFTQIINDATPGQLKFVYGSISGCPEGTLLTFQLKVIGGQNGYHYIRVNDAKAANTSVDRLTMMNCRTTNTNVYPQLKPEVLYYTLHQDAETVSNGDTVTLKLRADGVAFGGLQATLNYNAEQLEYVSGSAAFSDVFANGATISMVNDSAAGVIKLIYSNVNGYTPDGADIFSAQFKVRTCTDIDAVALTNIKTTNASSDNLHEMESVFIQEVIWPDVLTGHDVVINAAVPPTCTETGLTESRYCSICDEVLVEQQVVPALGHTEVVDAAVEPTCTKTGLTEGMHCSVCGKVWVEQQIVPALGHTEVVDVAVESTCTETGLTEGMHCSVCSEILVQQQVIPLKEHSGVESDGFAATDFTDGRTAGTYCSECNTSLNGYELIPAHCVIEKGVLTKYNGSTAELIIPDNLGITQIGSQAFYKNTMLTSIEIPEGVVSINGSAFWDCSQLAYVGLPNTLTTLGSYAFYSCDSLANIILPSNMTSIGSSAFSSCYGLTEIILPEGIQSVGSSAFSSCSKLTGIHLPASLKDIGTEVFSSCNSLKSLTIAAGNTSFKVSDGMLMTADETELIECLPFKSGEVSVPNGISIIRKQAFSTCRNLTTVNLPAGLDRIGSFAFSGCSNLSQIKIPDSVTYIDSYAFYLCSALQAIELPERVGFIGSNAFGGCSKLTAKVYLDSYAWEYCENNGVAYLPLDNATGITLDIDEVTLQPGETASLTATIYFGDHAYKNQLVAFTTSDELIADVATVNGTVTAHICGTTTITATAQGGVSADCTIIVGSGTHVETTDAAVAPTCTETGLTEGSHCSVCGEVLNMQEIVDPLGHTIRFEQPIYETTVHGEATLLSVEFVCGHDVNVNFTIPEELESVNTTGNSINITGKTPGVVTVSAEISDHSPKTTSCTIVVHAAKQLVLPQALTIIEDEAFINSVIEEVVIGDKVTIIGERAFAYCNNLALINIPNGIQIEQNAFLGCDHLTIICTEGSTAHEYAELYSIPYVIY